MSHRVIISSNVKAMLQDPEVSSQLTSNQQTRVTPICDDPEPPCDDDMHFLLRCLGRVYSSED